ncbi:anhydro-N-acetylmuramic acid kinase [Patiriisocius marinistellae]|uniref:Anhydro-N-acetylmuramic acid kinase n=2 Tax=Patiriisocius marinistellae TaxID=2494560 RepID=A0A5J4G0G4_9FLAO|nr:anhydro-N-acetylmuramic acid kinase [Patiriisocius marinistellae]
MSGTSLDGIDLAEVTFSISKKGEWSYKFGKAETVPYHESLKQELQDAILFSEKALNKLNIRYTRHISEVISAFVDKFKIESIDAVCSHGHTILHQPDSGVTLQIGNLPEIAALIGQRVVCDFRVKDVQLGGQGAPLVPIGDKLIFKDFDYCLNLGGFANVSLDNNGKRVAYDICPVNIVLNSYANLLGFPYDDNGNIARGGTVIIEILESLNQLPFYKKSPPKSLGLEWVKENIFPVLEASNTTKKNKIATFTAHIANQIAHQFKTNSKVLVTGGGAYNTFLLEEIKRINPVELVVPESQLLEFKEALIFGLLGVLRLRGEINCLQSVTGASVDCSGGNIFEI